MARSKAERAAQELSRVQGSHGAGGAQRGREWTAGACSADGGVRVGTAWEKRDWGSGRRTWRIVPPLFSRQRRGRGPSEYAVRYVTNRRAKRVVKC